MELDRDLPKGMESDRDFPDCGVFDRDTRGKLGSSVEPDRNLSKAMESDRDLPDVEMLICVSVLERGLTILAVALELGLLTIVWFVLGSFSFFRPFISLSSTY